MKRSAAVLGLTVVSLFTAFILPASADWGPGEPAKWVQPPDLTTEGMDVRATSDLILADNFPCNLTGPITNIHIWGSWREEYSPNPAQAENVAFQLSIHADVPTNDPQNSGPYSFPGETLWYTNFMPGEFTVRMVHEGNEWWYDPSIPEVLNPGDAVCWQYNFPIERDQAFM